MLTKTTISIAGYAETTNCYPFRLLEFEAALQPGDFIILEQPRLPSPSIFVVETTESLRETPVS
jgi:hypothetical protein